MTEQQKATAIDIQTKEEIRQKRRDELETTPFQMGPQGGALMQPRNGRELMDQANFLSGANFMVAPMYRNNPGDCAALIMICQNYQMNPFTVSWKTYKASKSNDAPISFEAQLINAMVNVSAPIRGRLQYKYDGTGEDLSCTVIGIDRETGAELEYISPPIGQIRIKNSPLWKNDPQQQLGYFSSRSWARRHFPELILGVYAREEMDGPQIKDVTPQESNSGFANLGQAARKAAEIAQENPDDDLAGVIPDGVEIEAEAEEVGADEADDGGEPTEAFISGRDAALEGQEVESCPFDEGSESATDWVAGFLEAQRDLD